MRQSFFGFQVATKPPSKGWRSKLVTRIKDALDDRSPHDKHRTYGDVADLLAQAGDGLALGYWDYVPGAQARPEYGEWVEGVESTSPGEGGGDHVLVTCAFLVQADSASDGFLAGLCDLEEASWFDRTTILGLIGGLKHLEFANVVSDAIYLAPRDHEHDLTAAELSGEGYEYLHRLLPFTTIVHAGLAHGAARCAYCHDAIHPEGLDQVECPSCRTILHAACWAELGRCPVLGCEGLNS